MINHITYHALLKEQGTTENVTIELNPDELPVADSTNELLKQLMERYSSKAGKGYGVFEEDTDSYPAVAILTDYIEEIDSFYQITERFMNVLKTESESQVFAKGGKVVFINYTDNEKEYFLVAILSEKIGLLAKDWNLTQDEFLNFENLRFAGRISLTDWQDPERSEDCRYISFLKGQGEIAGYFKKFLGCNDVLIPKKETQALIDYLEKFAVEQELSLEARTQLRNRADIHLTGLLESEDVFILQTFANVIWADAPQDLIDSFESNGRDNGYEISDGFIPYKRSLRSLRVYSHKTKHWSLSFDVDAYTNGDIEVDVENGSITITNVPIELLQPFSSED
ncbi:nucleoid-associated protein [Psychrobacter frigidicola]|uniref:nucleoid-associated protein n=1 Tax=Psychrobacter frigidicola TaxID=45611 RepID=UPI001917D2CB|nr:nucleoid-associated protein [Psychrobacter frigidicola]